jgi:hypothetical protein
MKALHVALMLATTTVIATAADGEKYVSKEGQFAVAFPKGSKIRTETKKKGNHVSLNAVTEVAVCEPLSGFTFFRSDFR